MYSSPRAAAASRHLLERVAAVGLGGVHVHVAAEVAGRHQPRQRASSRRPRSRRGSRAAPGAPTPARAPGRSPPRSRRQFAPRRLALNSPYSFSRQPRSSARSRRTMLWAFEPVKYCSAAPRSWAATARRSACRPPRSSTRGLGLAAAEHALDQRIGGEQRRAPRRRRRRRGGRRRRRSRRRAAGCRPARCRGPAAAPAATRSPPARRAMASGSRWRPECCCRSSSACRMSASFLAPMPLSPRMRPARAAASSSGRLVDSQLLIQPPAVLGPTPCSASTSSSVTG